MGQKKNHQECKVRPIQLLMLRWCPCYTHNYLLLQCAKDKTSKACQRRLRYTLKDKLTQSNVTAYVGEALQDPVSFKILIYPLFLLIFMHIPVCKLKRFPLGQLALYSTDDEPSCEVELGLTRKKVTASVSQLHSGLMCITFCLSVVWT